MAVPGAPVGRKLSGASPTARRSAGKLSGAVGVRGRSKLPLKGGNPSGPHASLISGAQKFGKLPGAD